MPSAICAAKLRATLSTPPPAANGTTKVMGRLGQGSAAHADNVSANVRARAKVSLPQPQVSAPQLLDWVFCAWDTGSSCQVEKSLLGEELTPSLRVGTESNKTPISGLPLKCHRHALKLALNGVEC
jgi:hypothetical protein